MAERNQTVKGKDSSRKVKDCGENQMISKEEHVLSGSLPLPKQIRVEKAAIDDRRGEWIAGGETNKVQQQQEQQQQQQQQQQ